MQRELYNDCKSKDIGEYDITWGDLAKKYNILSGKILQDRWYRIRNKPNPFLEDDSDIESKEKRIEAPLGTNEEEGEDSSFIESKSKDVFEYGKNGVSISEKLIRMAKEDSKSSSAILLAHGFDPEEWELLKAKNSMWNSAKKNSDPIALFSSRIEIKPIIEQWGEKTLDKLFEGFEKKSFQPVKIESSSYSNNGKALIIPIADLHIGLYATMQANNNEYNMEIMEKLYLSTISQIKERVKGLDFEEVIFVVGNDFLNTDNLSNTTSHGTPQDSAVFWYSIVDKAIELISIGINSFLEIAPVHVYNVVSNHDGQSMYGIMKVVETMYKSNDDVCVDTSPLPRKYHRFGKTIVALTHDMNIKKALETITVEAKEMWSDCNKFYFLLAHLHTEMQYQKSGLLEIYRLPTISGYSRWSNEKAFIQTEKKTQCFIVDKNLGILDTLYIIV